MGVSYLDHRFDVNLFRLHIPSYSAGIAMAGITKTLLAILLLLPLSVSAGELDGKALICENEDRAILLGVEFKRGEVTHYSNGIFNSRAFLEKLKPIGGGIYRTTPKTVHWWDDTYTLNRESLALEYRWIGRYTVSEEIDFDCELADSPEAMLKTIEAARLKMQKQIDEEMSNNKI